MAKGNISIQLGVVKRISVCLIQALVEKYNDDHNLLGDFAYELKEFLQIGEMYEDQRYYYHINFTTKIKGAHKSDCAMDNLFLAELSHMQGKDEWVVSCCCVIKPTANGNLYSLSLFNYCMFMLLVQLLYYLQFQFNIVAHIVFCFKKYSTKSVCCACTK